MIKTKSGIVRSSFLKRNLNIVVVLRKNQIEVKLDVVFVYIMVNFVTKNCSIS